MGPDSVWGRSGGSSGGPWLANMEQEQWDAPQAHVSLSLQKCLELPWGFAAPRSGRSKPWVGNWCQSLRPAAAAQP